MERAVFRRSWALTAIMAAVLIPMTILWWSSTGWVVVAGLLAINVATNWRERLVCDTAGVHVTLLRTRHLPWSEIRGFRPSSSFRGGTDIVTTTGVVWSPAPTSWWGGPASAADIWSLEGARKHAMRPSGEQPA